jgi:hypothetical protein
MTSDSSWTLGGKVGRIPAIRNIDSGFLFNARATLMQKSALAGTACLITSATSVWDMPARLANSRIDQLRPRSSAVNISDKLVAIA